MNKKELFSEMQTIVDKYVEFYKSDFDDYDKNAIDKWNDTRWTAVWMVRDCGTHLIKMTNNSGVMGSIDAVCDNMRVLKEYIIQKSPDGFEISETNQTEIKKLYDNLPKCRLKLYIDTYCCYDDIGTFRSKTEAMKFLKKIGERYDYETNSYVDML